MKSCHLCDESVVGHVCGDYRIAENFQWRKLSQISRFCGYSRKFSLRSLGAWRPLVRHSEQSAKVFRKNGCNVAFVISLVVSQMMKSIA